ncbi:MAG TPA: nucleotidyltransferase domain-containing protein [Streptosporangiaceae bacterium]|nr:nucleotidyltransferase domain-containing protein [Streptosporangiaceae bacterium]
MDVPPEISGHLDRFRDGLLALVDLRGLYLYGSLTTGDFSPASSDIDVLAVTGGRPDGTALARLTDLHRDLARGGGAYARLNCLYVPDGTLTDAELLHTYWYVDGFTQWRLKVLTVAELRHSGCAVHGPWPPPGLPEVSIGEVQAHARRELTGYWRPLTYRPRIWLQDRWVDFALITLARSEALTHDGVLITKSQAIARLGDFGVPPSLADQIRRRRAGERVPVTTRQRLLRAARARQIMAAGIRDITRS